MNPRTRIKIIMLEEKQNKNQKLFNSLGLDIKLKTNYELKKISKK